MRRSHSAEFSPQSPQGVKNLPLIMTEDELVFIASILFVRLAHAFSAARAQESLAEVAAAQRASREELAAAATAAAAGLPPGLVAEVLPRRPICFSSASLRPGISGEPLQRCTTHW